jgi:chromate reductase, NAD(P)H dehydrogenase (quinone)
MSTINISVIVGSNRRESINRHLANALVRIGQHERYVFSFIDIAHLPMYNADLEAARPQAVNEFTHAVEKSDGLLIVTPEHNRSITAVLKNALDWGSKPKSVWRNKPVAITGTSPGVIGTAVGQQHLRQILGVLGALVMGGEAYVSFRPGLIDAEGEVTNIDTREFLGNYLAQFQDLVSMLCPIRE